MLDVNFTDKTATISCPQDKTAAREAVEAALKPSGRYGVASFDEVPAQPSGS